MGGAAFMLLLLALALALLVLLLPLVVTDDVAEPDGVRPDGYGAANEE